MLRKRFFLISLVALIVVAFFLSDLQPDRLISDYAVSLHGTLIYRFAFMITQLGSRTFLVPFTIVMGIFLWIVYQRMLPMIIFLSGTLLSYLSNELIKQIFMRERPAVLSSANATGYSFPSGHAMIPLVCYGLLLYYLHSKTQSHTLRTLLIIFLVGLISAIGTSRIIINVHYLSDVIAGFILGFLMLCFFIKIDQTYDQRSN